MSDFPSGASDWTFLVLMSLTYLAVGVKFLYEVLKRREDLRADVHDAQVAPFVVLGFLALIVFWAPAVLLLSLWGACLWISDRAGEHADT